MYEIYYKQTAGERYGEGSPDEVDFDALMNARVRRVLESASVEITEEFGGCALGSDDPDELVAEAGFVVDTDIDTLNRLSGAIKDIVGRDIEVTECEELEG